MSAANALVKTFPVEIRIDSGPRGGQRLVCTKSRYSIGRDVENDLVLSDDLRMSRRHAELVFSQAGLTLQNLSQKNPVQYLGHEVQSVLVSGVISVQIGDTKLTIRPLEDLQASADLRVVSPNPVQSVGDRGANREKVQNQNIKSGQLRAQQKQNNFILVVIGVAAVLGWLLLQTNSKNSRGNLVRGQGQVIMDLEKSESNIKAIEKKQEDLGQQTLQFKTAQEHYLRGFRDYRQGQYARAISSFQAALSFYPQHELAKKYLQLAKRKFDEAVQANMVQGKRYKGKNNFRLCKSAYASAMMMIKDPSDPIYKEAKQFYSECSLLLEGQ